MPRPRSCRGKAARCAAVIGLATLGCGALAKVTRWPTIGQRAALGSYRHSRRWRRQARRWISTENHRLNWHEHALLRRRDCKSDAERGSSPWRHCERHLLGRLTLRARSGAPRCAGPGCRACASSRCQRPSVSTLTGFHHSRNSVWPATPTVMTTAALPVAGDRGPSCPSRCARSTGPLDELARCSRTALHCTSLRSAPVRGARARSSPRPPATPEAGPPEDQQPDAR